MTSQLRRWAGVVALAVLPLLGAVGCGQRPTPEAAGAASLPVATSTTSALSATAAASGSVEPTTRPAPGDGAPHHAENNGWKQRATLSQAEREAGERAAGPVRTKLEELRVKGDIAPEAVRRALLDLGHKPGAVTVVPRRGSAAAPEEPPPGSVYGVLVERVTCVGGVVSPEGVRVEVEGSAREFGCVEPFSH
ncbi:hypothetical protein LX15_002790 [Streptoalloteichus tenebrarius]|uniref:Uncharacterized protein n=1 Tax=Streptoalloteichus tenebrarius (strain ATCC 17920 / DSM 40477 / JCM 4838 / CBS 697.72 / NBRC 16177 / NCIMB 11028 / NRRL B-12390 / A12253. 1 / ISP 5477) TaxID=1933 RepID=A0ABT1HU94_STRSD|nr:hypothetical protein [Streptoalloteichus tenebrarius]MCP2259089.1 hypothetical protein [Streptoalloteichus tenebrarius]